MSSGCSKLAGGVAVIRVGGATEVEVKERKDRVDDAMHATRAAVEEGILPGGGVALLRAIEVLKKIRTANDDQKTGVDIVRKALSNPARQIAINAGEDGSVIVGKILEKDQYAYGFDAQNGEYVNMLTKGIIDPTKVVRQALQGAASVAGLLITTEAMVAEVPKKQGAAAAAACPRAAEWISKSSPPTAEKCEGPGEIPGLFPCAHHGTIGYEAPMNVQLPMRMDKPAFLAWVQGHEERYELADGRVVMMTGASRTHGLLVLNIAMLLRNQTRSHDRHCGLRPGCRTKNVTVSGCHGGSRWRRVHHERPNSADRGSLAFDRSTRLGRQGRRIPAPAQSRGVCRDRAK